MDFNKYKVIITGRAKNDLENIYEYISLSLMAENAASNLISKIKNKILRLEDFPESCSIIERYKNKKYKYRKLIINNYVAIYRIDKDIKKVYIVRVIYSGRDYLDVV